MKKTFFIALVSCAILIPSSVVGQKKGTTKRATKQTLPAPVIKTEVDSISYIYGAALVQGLPTYLTQMGVLGDTAAVAADFNARIGAEGDAARKTALQKEMSTKLDSINKANKGNLAEFLDGFKQAMLDDKQSKAFNSGIAIASQVGGMTENFAKEVLGDAKALNRNIFLSSFITNLNNEKPIIEVQNPQEYVQKKAQDAQQKKEIAEAEKLHEQYAGQISAGRKFFAENKTKEGIVALPNGLQYKANVTGTGAKPLASDMVKVHYKGTLLDGTTFDSSYDRGEPATFSVGHVIKGWTEALQLMPVGSKWTLYIPYDLAYGSRDQGMIKPFSDLVFEVELLDIIKPEDVEAQGGY